MVFSSCFYKVIYIIEVIKTTVRAYCAGWNGFFTVKAYSDVCELVDHLKGSL